ncbi:MAG: S24/S26 family peptidase [Bacteroidales bacterium]|nr:S24/S26 family peptidase [Bacteroidales bacterium]
MNTIIVDKKIMMEEIRTLISEGRTVELTAKGYSMNPFIMHLRDTIALGPWKDEDIRKGTVVLAQTTYGDYVVHRIISRDGETVTLLGDGNIGITEKAHIKDIIGRMYSVKRKERTYKVKGLAWRLYSWLWMQITPVKRYPLALWRKFNPQQPLR